MHRNDAIIGVSRFVADSAIDLGYDPANVYAVVNSIDSTKWAELRDDGAIQQVDIDYNRVVLSIIFRLFSWKGHELLLDAAAKLRDDGVSFKLLIVGEDDPTANPGGGSFRQTLEDLTIRLALTDYVTFTGFRTDVREILAATDIYAMPTLEPCAVTFLEAMSMAKPVVALRSGGTPELVDHGVSGLLSEPGDAQETSPPTFGR